MKSMHDVGSGAAATPDAAAAPETPVPLPVGRTVESGTLPIRRHFSSSSSSSSTSGASVASQWAAAPVVSGSGEEDASGGPPALFSALTPQMPLVSILHSRASDILQQRQHKMAEQGMQKAPIGGFSGRMGEGVVYDISSYLRFHPGGSQVLLGVAGREAYSEFVKYHPWVNYRFILENCRVGILTTNASAKSTEAHLLPGFAQPSSKPQRRCKDPLRIALEQPGGETPKGLLLPTPEGCDEAEEGSPRTPQFGDL
ncbi:cytochrome b5-like heme steroid binding domain-containing protein [Cyclospora cayetanensis]|uniref:Cytochrome b5-like heme steroid binding domain-containing protein n=1 Tax=Cyclospora cayetanensis TaxID=88456 RepID=A0A1D3CWD1_9EIME|nr:cytochrome b5-like heme steroid binding domain-containing protein [Cyclospora cayetanensis]